MRAEKFPLTSPPINSKDLERTTVAILEQVNNCIKIGGQYIPAVNIQVEGVPGMLKHVDGTSAWYGVYFEILFETGALWIVEQGFNGPDDMSITVTEYPKYGLTEDTSIRGVVVGMNTWREFVSLYQEKVECDRKVWCDKIPGGPI